MGSPYFLYSTDFKANELTTVWIALFENGQLIPLVLSCRCRTVDDIDGTFQEVPIISGDYWARVEYFRPFQVRVTVFNEPPTPKGELPNAVAIFNSIYKAQDWYNGGSL